jgi:hypothetical protein
MCNFRGHLKQNTTWKTSFKFKLWVIVEKYIAHNVVINKLDGNWGEKLIIIIRLLNSKSEITKQVNDRRQCSVNARWQVTSYSTSQMVTQAAQTVRVPACNSQLELNFRQMPASTR